MSFLNFTDLPFEGLVQERQIPTDNTTMFVTISPNPKTMIKCEVTHRVTKKKRIVKRPYGTLRQALQYDYCIKVLQEDYLSVLGTDVQIAGIAELNKTGNIHFHMLIKSPRVHNETQMHVFRRDILNCPRVQENIQKGKVNPRDWMNNIVFVTQPRQDIINYFMKKQDEMLPFFLNYYL